MALSPQERRRRMQLMLLSAAAFYSSKASFTPLSLFASGEQGFWYDPSDFSTMFQDSAGTTPVTAVEQPVGLILDKSKGLTLGSELVTNGTFDTDLSGWSNLSSAFVWSSGKAASVGVGDLLQTGGTIGRTYICTFTISAASGSGLYISLVGSDVGYFTNGTYTRYVVCTATDKKFRVRVFAGSGGEIDNISVRELPGNHASQSTDASRPVLKQDSNGNYYLLFDGTDDSLSTATIEFSATDKVSVFAGLLKETDPASTALVVELSSSTVNVGSFGLQSSRAVAGKPYAFESGGSIPFAALATSSAYTAPHSAVIAGTSDISGDLAKIRVNGTLEGQSTANQGTGNYGNYPLYIGRRGGIINQFNGRLYSLIGLGRIATATEITNTETWVNSKCRAF